MTSAKENENNGAQNLEKLVVASRKKVFRIATLGVGGTNGVLRTVGRNQTVNILHKQPQFIKYKEYMAMAADPG